MVTTVTAVLACTIALAGAGVVSSLCREDATQVRSAFETAQKADTSTARLHISGMTCGTCPVTARVALKKLAGVYSALVTLEDSLGVVQYDPRRLTRDQLAAHLTKLTGYGARVLSDTSAARRKPDGA